MKWVFILLLFAGTTSSAQVNKQKELMQKLKLQEQLRKGNPKLQEQLIKGNSKTTVVITNPRQGRVVTYSEQRVTTLPQDNMPCIVPNMNFYRVMPNASDSTILKYPIDPGIYVQKPRLDKIPNQKIIMK